MVSFKIKIDTKQAMREITRRTNNARKATLQELGDEAKKLMRQPTTEWDEKVSFRKNQTRTRVAVGTDSERYKKVSEGFEHRRVFSDNFVPKTVPGSLISRPGSGSVVGVSLFTSETEPREFPEQVADELLLTGLADQTANKIYEEKLLGL